MNYNQIAILFLQSTLIAFVILLLFRLRKKLGIGILFACLGLFQFMQVFLSSTVYVPITNGFLVSPGSSVLFTATLFALLIIYIKEDASETRKIIYALLIVNIVMSILIQTFSWNLKESSTYNPFNVSIDLFNNNAWVLFVGTLALFLDSLLIIILYEYLSRHLRFIFLQICITMLIVVSFDTLFFSLIALWNFDNLKVIVLSGLISKGVFSIFYSILFYIYLKYFETMKKVTGIFRIKDVFHMLTYKQKFETANVDIKKVSEKLALKETRYQTLTNISPVGIFQTNSHGYTTFVNNRLCEITGVIKKEALGWGWLGAVHPEDRPTIQKEWNLALEQKRKSELNYRLNFTDGTVKWVLAQAIPEYDSQNQVIGFIGTITDITEIKLYQQEQIILRKKADESNRLKSAFLANMSHEIRTPMNGILGFSDLLKEPNLSGEEQQSYIEIIEKSGARMLNIINDIISISKIESGTTEINIKELNINEQQEYLYNFFKPEAQEKNLELSFKSALSNADSVVCTDQEKFISIYTNLIKNAIKYTEKGSIEFGYIINGDFLEFYIKDTGIGVDSNRQEAIFERFVQADIEDKMARQGVGLGLSISKAYSKMIGGSIWVESEKEKGSIFYFTIPYAVEKNKQNSIVSTPLDLDIQIENLTILLVEDDTTSSLLVDTMFKKTRCTILHASNGIQAVAICRKNPNIDLVLMDIRMPEMDGYEATREIRKFNKVVFIIAQTAHALSSDIHKSIEAGCNEHLSKPINKNELFSIIKNHFTD